MGTVKAFVTTHRKRLLLFAALVVSLLLGAVAWYVAVSQGKPASKGRTSPRPTALPEDLIAKTGDNQPTVTTASAAAADSAGKPGDVQGKTDSAGKPGDVQGKTDSAGKPGDVQGKEDSANAKTIVVQSRGKAAALDVQTVMALQRERAERRLYDRVVALSAAGGASIASGVKLAPGPINVPPTRSDETALGSLLGGKHAVDRVPSGTPGLSSTVSEIPPGMPGDHPEPQPVEKKVIRLVSVYARGEYLMAELMLPSGRRIDLEKDDDLMGFRVVRVDEGGLTLAGWYGSTRSVFLAVGKTLLH